MRALSRLILLFFGASLSGQTALYNNGNLRIHGDGQLGIHTEFINDAPTDMNLGLVGFYGDSLRVSGNAVPLFYDVEVNLDHHLELLSGLDVAHNTNFINGDILTEKTRTERSYTFVDEAFYNGESAFSKVNGFASLTNKMNFIFPVGSAESLRPLILNSERINFLARCAYFRENPNTPISFDDRFNTDDISRELGFVSEREFWRLEGNVPSRIGLSWTSDSDLVSLTDDVELVVVVGWSKSQEEWVSLGRTNSLGSITEGAITSDSFVPDDYEVITLGTTRDALEATESDLFDLDNFYLSPNGDGINDRWVIPELSESPNNKVSVFDRHGLKVFEQDNYRDEFRGFSNAGTLVIEREEGLPSGIYFYVIKMFDLNLEYQGFLYLTE